jgi:hypothetical protein
LLGKVLDLVDGGIQEVSYNLPVASGALHPGLCREV